MPKQATVFDDRDERISMEIIVDCYDDEE